MKKIFLLLISIVLFSLESKAISYDEAKEYAWQLTDKMAYELDLTDEQYDRAYEINLDYLLSVDSSRDLYGTYWSYRCNDLRFILMDWQYSRFIGVDYFYRPIRWYNNYFYYPLYRHYRRGTLYFGTRPVMYSYRGRRYVSGRRYSPYRDIHYRHDGGLRNRYDRMNKRPSSTGRPSYNRPEYNRPNNNRPGNSRPNYNRPESNRPVNNSNSGRPNRNDKGDIFKKNNSENRRTERNGDARTQSRTRTSERPSRTGR